MMMDESIEGGMLPDDSAWRTEEGGLEICVRAGKVFFFLCLSTFIFLFFFFLNKLTFFFFLFSSSSSWFQQVIS